MPPKKAQAAQAVKKKQEKQKVEDQRQQDEIQDVEVVDEDINNKNATKGEKRKSAPTKAEEPEPKAAKTSTSSSLKVGAIIKFLLSDAALQLCQNEENASSSGKGYFSADLSPFEHLLCAVILSRPLSHNLGQRTIATVLNDPYGWRNAEDISPKTSSKPFAIFRRRSY